MSEGTELGKAYVQIVPSAKGMKGAMTKAMNGEAKSAGEKSGLKISSLIKKAIVGAGIGLALKKTLDIGGDLQQSYVGGLETLYGDAAEAARKYADEAYKAGISMNTYSEQAVSFGAALKSAYGGDVKLAAEAANTAIMDMADNSAKMGTDIGSVQTAYQGFAKQNYTMLDNLKLGYGGTKTEMERLLKDAEKLTGIKYDINNLGDVYSAIHAVQEDLGLAGVAAHEASETFSGSMGAMKAAAENFMGNLMLGQNIEESMSGLVETSSTFLFKNLIPAVGNIFKSLPAAAGTFIKTGIPELINSGKELITGLITGAQEKIPEITTKVTELIPQITETISSKGSELLEKGRELIGQLGEGIASKGPDLLAKGGEIVVNLANGVLQSIPSLLAKGSEMISGLVSYLADNLPKFAEKGGEILKNLASGFVSNLPSIISAAAKFGVTLLGNILKLGGSLLKAGGTLIMNLVKGLGGSALSLVSSAAGKIKETLLKPIEAGKEKIKGIVDAIKNFFNFRIKFPHIPLPHFSVTPAGWKIGDLLEGKLPKLGITWNADAVSTPKLFKNATLFGAGETSDEIMYGRSNLLKDIKEATGERPINYNFYVTVDGAEDPEEWADKFVRRLKMDMRTA